MFKLLVLFLTLAASVHGHGRLVKPAGRSSLWRFPEFASQNPPANYDDHQLYCGGVLQNENPGRNCGVCGDPAGDRSPRPNEHGGHYGGGIIAARYSAGQVIDVEVELTQSHNGFMEWRLCTSRSNDQNCFNQHVLQLESGGTRLNADRGSGLYRTRLRLPGGVRCNECVIQWNYRAAQHWSSDGPQENFRGCADVQIN